MTDPVLSCETITKRYRRGSAKSHLAEAMPWRHGDTEGTGWFTAVDGVSLTVGRGESVGLIGPNGAGKSTLLKMVAGVISPSEGQVHCEGRVASLIELGVGFHPDLTGEENVWFTGAVLGMSPSEVEDRFDEIVDFAGIPEAMDTPVKRYSTGMLARLGFAVASSVAADVLLVDEVLSVGDGDFRRRCYERMVALQEEGVTLIFVSHNLRLVEQLCDRAVLLDHGRVVDDGPADEVCDRYSAGGSLSVEAGSDAGEPVPVGVEVLDLELATPAISTGDPLQVTATVRVTEPIPGARLEFSFRIPNRFMGLEIGARIDPADLAWGEDDGEEIDWILRTAAVEEVGVAAEHLARPGLWRVRGHIPYVPISPSLLEVVVAVVDRTRTVVISEQVRPLEVMGELSRAQLVIDSSWDLRPAAGSLVSP